MQSNFVFALKIGCITAGNDSASVRQGKLITSSFLDGTKCLKKAKKAWRMSPVHIKNCRKRTTWVTFFGHGPAFQRSYDHRTASNGKIGCAQSHHLGSCDGKICAKLVPKVLTVIQKQNREAVSNNILEYIEKDPHFLDNIITWDESWFFQYNPETKCHSNEWYTQQSLQQKKARMSKSRMKAMLIVFFDKNGVVHSEFVRNNSTAFLQP
ncbi:histone-lysine n-methyltransferase setmar-like protein [Trichonephila clavipes]|nr:histone-lysine n-methyltransferase setmar-like protein [Trichonephila clavipes]